MEIVHRLYWLCQIVMFMICSSKTDEYNLSWKVEKKVVQYGDDLSLVCQVDNCCLDSAGWGKWTTKNELNTIFIDVTDLDSNDNSKYAGGTHLNGFSLLIRNVSSDDLNIAYSCTYGFLVSKKKLLLRTDAFRSKPDNHHIKDNKPVSIELVMALSFSFLAVAGVVVVVICIFLKKKSKSEKKKCIHDTLSSQQSEQLNPMNIDRSKRADSLIPRTDSYPIVHRNNLGKSHGADSTSSGETFKTCKTSSEASFLRRTIHEDDEFVNRNLVDNTYSNEEEESKRHLHDEHMRKNMECYVPR